MRIKQFEAVYRSIYSSSEELERARNLFVTAEAATLREGCITVIGSSEVKRLLTACFSDKQVSDTEAFPVCLLYVASESLESLTLARNVLESNKELVCVFEHGSSPDVVKLVQELKLTVYTTCEDQILVQKNDPIKPICHWPWTELSIYVNGDIGVCCGSGGVHNVNPDNAGTAWHGEALRTMRKNLLNSQFKGVCERCPFRTLYNQEVTGAPPSSNLPVFPKSMSLIITEKCNLKCWFCDYTNTYKGKNRIKEAPELSIDLLYEIAPRFWKHLQSLNTNCGGEVFLYPHWDEVLSLMKAYPPKESISTSGGGIEVSEESWFKILETHTHWMFSVDSFDPQTHWIMRGCDIDIVKRNVEKIRKLRDAYFKKRVLGFSAVIMKLTVPTLFDFTRRAVEHHGAGMVAFQHVIGNPTQDPSTEPQWRQLFNCEMNKIRAYAARNNLSLGHPVGYYLDETGKPEGCKFFEHQDQL